MIASERGEARLLRDRPAYIVNPEFVERNTMSTMSKGWKIKPIAANEPAILSTNIEGDIATICFTAKPNGAVGGPRYNMRAILDFTGCTRTQLIAYCVRPLRIDFQTMWRKAANKLDGSTWLDRRILVTDMLAKKRHIATPAERVDKDVDKMSKHERDMLRAKLLAMDPEDADEDENEKEE